MVLREEGGGRGALRVRDGASQTRQTFTSHREPLRRVGPIYSREVTGVWDERNGCHRRPGGGWVG